MGQLITCVFVLAISLNLHAEVEFGSVISDGVYQQNQAARDIRESIASETPRLETTGIRMMASAEAPPEASGEQIVHHSDQESMGQDNKDFTVQLRPYGHAPAARYFEVAYREEQIRKAQERAERRLAKQAKKEKQRQARLARAQQKLKKSSRGVASVKSSRKLKNKTRKSAQTAQNGKSAN